MAAARNLVHDTLWRRARKTVTGVVHDIDDRIHRARTADVQILFEAASPMSVVTFAPVLSRLQSDARLEFWFTAADDAWSLDRIYGRAMRQRALPASEVRWRKFDAYINTDFWNMTWLPRRTPRIHFFHGVAGKYGLDAPIHIAPVVSNFDRLLFPNRDRLDRYVTAGLVDGRGAQAALVGYPKVDCLVDGSLDRDEIRRSLGLPGDRPVVVYAPTWSAASSLNVMGLEIIESLARSGVSVIVKIHDRSYDRTRRGSGGVDWRARLTEACRRGGGAHLASGTDAAPYLVAADLLVTDHSSVGFEFMLLNRPIVVVDCPDLVAHAQVNREKVSLLRSAATIADTPASVATAVRDALAHPSDFSDRRRRIAADLFYRPGGAADRAAQAIYDVLALPATVPVAAPPAFSDHQPRTSRRD